MHFAGKKVIAIDVVDHDGSVETVGRSKARADSTAADRTAHGTETTTRRQRTANRAEKEQANERHQAVD
jgi:ribosomal protein L14E/L6E/L27E